MNGSNVVRPSSSSFDQEADATVSDVQVVVVKDTTQIDGKGEKARRDSALDFIRRNTSGKQTNASHVFTVARAASKFKKRVEVPQDGKLCSRSTYSRLGGEAAFW